MVVHFLNLDITRVAYGTQLNSIVILATWTLWNHSNRCVLDGVPPCFARALLSQGRA